MSRWEYKEQEPALRAALLSMEGKDPLEATKPLEGTEVWEGSTHLLNTSCSRHRPHILTLPRLTTTARGVSYYWPQKHTVNHGTSLAPKCPRVSEQNHVWLSRGAFSGGHGIWKFGKGRMWINFKKGRLQTFPKEAQKIWRLLGRLWCRATGNCSGVVFQAVFKLYQTRGLVPLGK